MDETVYTIDDLPRFSPWPARLLGREPWEPRTKTPQEVTREFDHEKWGSLLRRVLKTGRPVSVEEVHDWLFHDSPPALCTLRGELKPMSFKSADALHVDLLAGVLERFLPAPALVELGCGYGAVILRLARHPSFRGMAFKAGEYAPSGVRLTEMLAAWQGTEITVGSCEFSRPGITEISIPEQALIFTSYAVHYVPDLQPATIRDLAARRPHAVFHFEPCYEHHDETTLLGLMRRRYIELNGYNTNLLTVLRQLEGQGEIEILDESPSVFGNNPLLPASVVAWRPRVD